jgi:hypothetical protein
VVRHLAVLHFYQELTRRALNVKISSFKKCSFRRAILPASIIAMMAMAGSANAFKVDSDNPDLDIRFDNTFRYTAGWRQQNPANYGPVALGGNSANGSNSIFTGASESKYKSGDLVTNRVDILTEFDFIYKKDSGFRVSAASWYDAVYQGHAPQGGPDTTAIGVPGTTGQNIFPGGRYPDETQRYYGGPSGEILDAFVFTKFDLGDVPVNVKLGKHNIYWGETLFSLASGIANSQAPVDIRKAVLTPGIEAKEVFLPLNQFSFSAQISPEFTIMGQYFLDWQHDRLMLGGTYTSFADMFGYSGTNANPYLPWTGSVNRHPKERSGDWGIAAKWRPDWLDGTAGLYFREFTPHSPGVAFDVTSTDGPFGAAGWAVDTSAPRTKLIGISLAKQLFGISFGTDIAHRTDYAGGAHLATAIVGPNFAGWMPLLSVWSATQNMIAYDGKRDLFGIPLYDSAVLTAEIEYEAIDKLKDGIDAAGNGTFFGAGMATCTPLNPGTRSMPTQGARGGCLTNYAYGINALFEPKWFQVFPGTDLSMPIFYGLGLKGNSPISYGPNEGVGAFSVGVTADVDAKYNFALKYNGYMGKHNGSGNANSALGDFSHKGWLSFTAKATW